jgi:thioredoxin
MNSAEFARKISQSDQPIIVDFWAPWCGPCRMTKPILEKLAREYQGKVEFLEVNADESAEVLRQHRVMGIPTVLAFRQGEQAARLVGARSEGDYRSVFDSLAEGKEVQVSIPQFQRWLRLGGGTLLALIGISSQNWFLLAAGAVVAFLGVYDRCPIWKAITEQVKELRGRMRHTHQPSGEDITAKDA